MGQAANKSRRQPNEAIAYGKFLKTSPQKLNLIAQTIRGKNAGRALVDLEFSPRRIAKEVRKVLQSAIANAENNHGLDVDRLFVSTATVGKTLVMKRFHARARGRAAGIEKKFSNITIIVKELDAAAEQAKADKKEKNKAKKENYKNAEGKKPAAKKQASKKSEKSGAEE